MRSLDETKAQVMEAIREWIKRERLTQGEAARRLGLPRTTVVEIVGGKSKYGFTALLEAWVRAGGQWEMTITHERRLTAEDIFQEPGHAGFRDTATSDSVPINRGGK